MRCAGLAAPRRLATDNHILFGALNRCLSSRRHQPTAALDTTAALDNTATFEATVAHDATTLAVAGVVAAAAISGASPTLTTDACPGWLVARVIG